MALRRNPTATFEGGAPAAAAPAPTADPAQPPAQAPVAPPPPPPTPAPAPAPAAAPAPVAPPAVAPAPVAAPVPAAQLPAVQAAGAVVVPGQYGNPRVLDTLKDALRVDWNTLYRVKAGQGRFAGEQGLNLGSWIEAELQSWQESWLITPGSDNDEAKEFARYSDDGKTIKGTGEDCQTYIARLVSMGYKDAALKKRCIVVMALLDCEKEVDLDEGKLFQIDMSTTSKDKFDQYRFQTVYDVSKGRHTADQSLLIRMDAIATTAGKKEWTVIHFKRKT